MNLAVSPSVTTTGSRALSSVGLAGQATSSDGLQTHKHTATITLTLNLTFSHTLTDAGLLIRMATIPTVQSLALTFTLNP